MVKKKKLMKFKKIRINDYFKKTENSEGHKFTRGDLVLSMFIGMLIPFALIILVIVLIFYFMNTEKYMEEVEDY